MPIELWRDADDDALDSLRAYGDDGAIPRPVQHNFTPLETPSRDRRLLERMLSREDRWTFRALEDGRVAATTVTPVTRRVLSRRFARFDRIARLAGYRLAGWDAQRAPDPRSPHEAPAGAWRM